MQCTYLVPNLICLQVKMLCMQLIQVRKHGTRSHAYICIQACVYICIRISIRIHMYTSMHTYVYMHLHVCQCTSHTNVRTFLACRTLVSLRRCAPLGSCAAWWWRLTCDDCCLHKGTSHNAYTHVFYLVPTLICLQAKMICMQLVQVRKHGTRSLHAQPFARLSHACICIRISTCICIRTSTCIHMYTLHAMYLLGSKFDLLASKDALHATDITQPFARLFHAYICIHAFTCLPMHITH
jgi:hypothetical protein